MVSHQLLTQEQILKCLNDSLSGTYTTGTGMTTAAAEALGDASGNSVLQKWHSQSRNQL